MLHAEKLLGGIELYDPSNIDMLHSITQAVRARALYRPDVEYVVIKLELCLGKQLLFWNNMFCRFFGSELIYTTLNG